MIPPIVREVEQLGSQLPTYVKDFEDWANNNDQFRELNDKYNITQLLSAARPRSCRRSSATPPAPRRTITVGILNNLVEAVIVLTLDLLPAARRRPAVRARSPGACREPQRERVRRIGVRIAEIVRSYVSVNLLLAALAGVFTWLALELLGVELAVPLAVLVAFLDLVPLIGFTVGGLLVAIVAGAARLPRRR